MTALYEVESIINRKIEKDVIFYEIKWKGYPKE